jgi:hypothetical protein
MMAGFLTAVLLFATITAFAAPGVITKSIEVTFANYKTSLFGQEYTVQDKEENVLMPFAYAGSVYFPMESILRALGSNAQWNENTGTLNYGAVADAESIGQQLPLQEAAPFYDSNWKHLQGFHNFGTDGRYYKVTNSEVIMSGNTYKNAILFSQRSESLSHNNATMAVQNTLHNLNKKYTYLTGLIGRVDKSASVNATIKIYGDGKLLATYELKPMNMPTQIKLQIKDVIQLRIEVTSGGFRQDDGIFQYAVVGYLG